MEELNGDISFEPTEDLKSLNVSETYFDSESKVGKFYNIIEQHGFSKKCSKKQPVKITIVQEEM
ncbi:hypothetical protein BA724_02855 [Domibacillus iocasae]|uniref:Uncharacterized protein n=2 Tax=Domibacillus iocasae TaxID=1714016 RepID=A0A1E7DRQ4_9BACI|nr:hypothetical protein BA724_02855 [Domibacillus iocasae]